MWPIQRIICGMSRSRKKHGHTSPCVMNRRSIKALKFFKTRASRRVRYAGIGEDIASGCAYKKREERYTWPDDGKTYYDKKHCEKYPEICRK